MASLFTPDHAQQARWGHALGQFLCGAFVANCIPHLVQGISGHAFPTPFASPPGIGLSSPEINALWGSANFAVAYVLGQAGRLDARVPAVAIRFFGGFTLLAYFMAQHFGQVMRG